MAGSVPLVEVLDANPELWDSLVKRAGLTRTNVRQLHVTFFECRTDWGAEVHRSTTIALLSRKPIATSFVGVGVAIKEPRDPDEGARGETIALGRALKRIDIGEDIPIALLG